MKERVVAMSLVPEYEYDVAWVAAGEVDFALLYKVSRALGELVTNRVRRGRYLATAALGTRRRIHATRR